MFVALKKSLTNHLHDWLHQSFFRPLGCKKAAAVVYQHYGQSSHHLAQLTVRLLFGFGHRDLSQTLNMASTCVQMKLQMPFIVHVLRFGLPCEHVQSLTHSLNN